MDRLFIENTTEIDDLGVPLFQETFIWEHIYEKYGVNIT